MDNSEKYSGKPDILRILEDGWWIHQSEKKNLDVVMGNDFCQRKLPEKDETICINANIKVWHEHVVHSTKPFVPEESVGHPNLR